MNILFHFHKKFECCSVKYFSNLVNYQIRKIFNAENNIVLKITYIFSTVVNCEKHTISDHAQDSSARNTFNVVQDNLNIAQDATQGNLNVFNGTQNFAQYAQGSHNVV